LQPLIDGFCPSSLLCFFFPSPLTRLGAIFLIDRGYFEGGRVTELQQTQNWPECPMADGMHVRTGKPEGIIMHFLNAIPNNLRQLHQN
jgi:hypothetical protein